MHTNERGCERTDERGKRAGWALINAWGAYEQPGVQVHERLLYAFGQFFFTFFFVFIVVSNDHSVNIYIKCKHAAYNTPNSNTYYGHSYHYLFFTLRRCSLILSLLVLRYTTVLLLTCCVPFLSECFLLHSRFPLKLIIHINFE